MKMNKEEMFKLFKKLCKGEIESIIIYEPKFDRVERGAKFFWCEDSIDVVLWNSWDNVKENKDMIVSRGLAWCFFKQAMYSAERVDVVERQI